MRATSSSTRSVTSRSSSCGATPTRSPRSSTPAPTGGPVWRRDRATSPPPRSDAGTTHGVGTSTDEIIEVVDRHDYPPALTDDDVRLGEVQVGRWGGFVFVNMDPDCEPFDVVPRRRTRALCVVPVRGPPVPLVSDHPLRLQLEDGGRFLQRGIPSPGPAPPDADLVRRHPLHYGPVGQHSLYGEKEYRRELGPSPRLGLDPEDYDEDELLADRIDAVRRAVLPRGPPPSRRPAP